MNRICKYIYFLFFAVASLQSEAENRVLLDSLVEKNILTPEESSIIMKESAYVIPATHSTASKITLSGRLQIQYTMMNADDGVVSASRNGFQVRRIYLATDAELSKDWRASFTGDLLRATSSTHMLVSAYLEKKYDLDYFYGRVRTGFLADNFAFESMSSSKSLVTIERSVASRYFSGTYSEQGKYSYSGYGSLEFGGESLGLYFRAIPRSIKKLDIGFAVSSPEPYRIEIPDDGRNIPAFWLNAKYRDSLEFDYDKLNYELGVYTGVNPQGSIEMYQGNEVGSIWGINPFFKVMGNNITLWADYLFANVQYGRADMRTANVMGANIVAEYRFDIGDYGKLAPAFRFSFLDTDGRGARIRDCTRKGPALYGDFRQYYDKAAALYLGLNWYLDGDSLKFMLGYERSKFWGEVNNNNVRNTNVDTFRAQVQVLF